LRQFPFPDRPRLWGVAVSHYQVEGGDTCDWTAWEAAGRAHEPCGDAMGSWQRYEEDAALAASLGSNAFRFSVSWSRVEPEPGRWDDEALARYRRLVDRLEALGLEPIVTLFHYTHPAWFHERTPWTSPRSVDAFTRFAARTAEALGPAVRLYTVLNEPLVSVLGGYLDARIPPGLSDAGAARKALDHMLAAHAASAAAIRERNPGAAIGIAHNVMGFAPCRPRHPLDRWLARKGHRFYNLALPEAFLTGRLDLRLPGMDLRSRRPELVGSLDVLGVNYYSRLHLRCPGRRRFLGDFGYEDRSGRGLTDLGWEVVPELLTELLLELAPLGLPMLITENGLADASDARRAEYLREHVAAVLEAERSGAPVSGYLHWSLLDNFEWLEGYAPRFGLVEVDRSTMARRPRPSAEVFRELGADYLSRP